MTEQQREEMYDAVVVATCTSFGDFGVRAKTAPLGDIPQRVSYPLPTPFIPIEMARLLLWVER